MKKTLLFLAAVLTAGMLSAQEEYPAGAAKGKFSISNTKQVYISQGNLYYEKYNWLSDFYFHEVDTAIVGVDHKWGESLSDDKLIDLFGWGTSGIDHKEPYLTSTDNSDYFEGHHSMFEKWKISEYSDYMANGYDYDWGSRRIKNGGDAEGQWRTPTYIELLLLLDRRTADNKPLAARGTIVGENGRYYRGYLLYPDDVNLASSLMLKDDNNNWSINAFAADVYVKTMVPAGGIFLPCAGWREGTDVYSDIDGTEKIDGRNVATTGWYWTSESISYNSSYCMIFDNTGVWFEQTERHIGASVRLVRDVPSEENPTGMESAEIQMSGKAKKIIRNGEVLILREGKVYNALGMEMK